MHLLLQEFYKRNYNNWKPEASESYLEKKFLEDVFWDVLQILKREETIFDLQPQFPFKCSENKNRRVDFVYRIGDWSIAFELDGKSKLEGENRTLNRDAFNDLIRRQNDLLNVVDHLLRFTYDDIHYNKEKCVATTVNRCRAFINKKKTNESIDIEKKLEEKLKVFAEIYQEKNIEEIKRVLKDYQQEKNVVTDEKSNSSKKNIYLISSVFIVLSAISYFFYSNNFDSKTDTKSYNEHIHTYVKTFEILERIETDIKCLSSSVFYSGHTLLCGQGLVKAYNDESREVTSMDVNVDSTDNILSCYYSTESNCFYLGLDKGEVSVNGDSNLILHPVNHIIAIGESPVNNILLFSVKHVGILKYDVRSSTVVDTLNYNKNIYAILKSTESNQCFFGDASGQLIITDFSMNTNEYIRISETPIRSICYGTENSTILIGDNSGNLYLYDFVHKTDVVLLKSFNRPILSIEQHRSVYRIVLEGGIIYQTRKI
ncbi:MAG: hypothetical protein J0M05_05395 [Candidatus Kapabacteria bacterium]|nr:hypothetical protein [Candidatus Kapabacteria bacterium]